MQLPEGVRRKLRQRLVKMSREKGKGVMLFCELAGLSPHTLYRLRDGEHAKEETIKKLVNGITAYDKYDPAQTERQNNLTESLLSVL